MKSIIAALFITATANAETIMLPVKDLLHDVPNFVTDHRFSISETLRGGFVPPEIPRGSRKTRREMEAELIDLMWEMHPDAESIRIWRGTLIVRFP